MSARMQITDAPKLAFSIDELCDATGVRRNLIYDEIKAGRLKSRKLGRRTIILDEDARSWLRALPNNEAA